jgi:hypothetical protein
MMKRTLSAALAVGLASAALLGAQGAASACPVYGPIADRLGSLNAKLHDLPERSPLTPNDAQALREIITSDISGLTHLNSEIQSTTDKHQVAQEKYDVYKDFRVYVLVGPQFDLSTAADAGAKAASDLRGQEPALHKDATTPLKKAEYQNLVLNVDTALSVLPGIGPSVLAQTPFTSFEPVIAVSGKALARGIAALDKAEADASSITS